MNKQSGNALWFILLAIFLLGGLTVLLSRTGSNTEETGDTERTSLYASEILKYASSLETGVQQLLSRGCSENQISFDHGNHDPGIYANGNSPVDGSCHLFHVNGAGIPFVSKKDAWRDLSVPSYNNWHMYAGQCIYGIGKGTTTCTSSETDLFVTAGTIKKEICVEINRRLGVSNPSGNPPTDEMLATMMVGSFAPGSGTFTTDMIGDAATATALPLQNKKAACLEQATNPGFYIFYKLILAR